MLHFGFSCSCLQLGVALVRVQKKRNINAPVTLKKPSISLMDVPVTLERAIDELLAIIFNYLS